MPSSQAQVLAVSALFWKGVLIRTSTTVEMFKVRMQGQYGAKMDKRLRAVVGEMWKNWGFRKGVMRGYWASCKKSLHFHTADTQYSFRA